MSDRATAKARAVLLELQHHGFSVREVVAFAEVVAQEALRVHCAGMSAVRTAVNAAEEQILSERCGQPYRVSPDAGHSIPLRGARGAGA